MGAPEMARASKAAETGRRRRARGRICAGSPAGSRRPQAIQAAVHAWRRTFGILHKLTHGAAGSEITMADAFLLHFIAMHGEQSPTAIAAFTGLTSGSVTSMLDRLERAGLVQRARSTEDRRVVIVSLTPHSHEKLAETIERAHLGVDRLFVGWATEEIETFAALLEKFGSVEFDS